MAQSLSQILLHIIFRTKDQNTLIPTNNLKALHAYISGICRKLDSIAYCVGGIENHVHIACSLPRNISVSDLVRDIKSSSTTWLKAESPNCAQFAWQGGYGVFSLGQSQLDSIINYIQNQEEHHKQLGFKEELSILLEKYKVEYDEKYL